MSAGEGARGEGGWTRDEAGGGGGRRRIIVGALDLDTILDFGLVCQRYENFLDPKDTKTLSDSKDTKTFWIQKIENIRYRYLNLVAGDGAPSTRVTYL